MMFVAETERIILRRLVLSDAPELFRIYSEPGTTRFLGAGPTSVDEERRNIAKHISSYYDVHGFGLWGMVSKETGHLIGRCGILYQAINGKRDAELAYLLEPHCWGRGLATEASRAVMEIAAREFGFSRMVAVIHPENEASIRVIERLGFHFETRLANYKDFGNVLLYARILDSVPAN